MRLLNVKTLAFEEFMDERVTPRYAILSHTWDTEEVTYQDMCDGLSQAVQQKAGFAKIKMACEQADTDGLRFCWVDTCCIDKKSSAELSEAINSMFRWYACSKVCYAYLKDVKVVARSATNLRQSKWFTRGWTLQELIAPRTIEFYGSDWKHFGTGALLAEPLSKITGIDVEILCRELSLRDVCVARRMSWASTRQTTRTEDIAYCLLGIFDVNMPLLYGEGHKAFYRLQEQIIRETGDDSILAWDYVKFDDREDDLNDHNVLFAPSPGFFRNCRNVQHCRPIAWNDGVDLTNHGLRFRSHYISGSALAESVRGDPVPNEAVLLNCYCEDTPGLRFALRLQQYAGSSSAERGYSIRPHALGVKNPKDLLWQISRGWGTRLVSVRRDREYAAMERETGLITKHFLVGTPSLYLNVVLMPSDRLQFERILRPPHLYQEASDGSVASTFRLMTGEVLTEEGHSSSSWSETFPSQHRHKLIVVGACIRDRVSNRSFMMICGHQEPSVEPRSFDDGDCGVELHAATDSAGDSLLTADSHDRVLLALCQKTHETRNTPRDKKCTFYMPRVGVATATCSVVHSEGLTMNVKVVLMAEDRPIQRKSKRQRIN